MYDGTKPTFPLYMNESLCCCLLCERVNHPQSLYRFSNDTDLVSPVTRRAGVYLLKCLRVPLRASIPYHWCILNNGKQIGHIHLVESFSADNIE